jgi:hypothetical protein
MVISRASARRPHRGRARVAGAERESTAASLVVAGRTGAGEPGSRPA